MGAGALGPQMGAGVLECWAPRCSARDGAEDSGKTRDALDESKLMIPNFREPVQLATEVTPNSQNR